MSTATLTHPGAAGPAAQAKAEPRAGHQPQPLPDSLEHRGGRLRYRAHGWEQIERCEELMRLAQYLARCAADMQLLDDTAEVSSRQVPLRTFWISMQTHQIGVGYTQYMASTRLSLADAKRVAERMTELYVPERERESFGRTHFGYEVQPYVGEPTEPLDAQALDDVCRQIKAQLSPIEKSARRKKARCPKQRTRWGVFEVEPMT